MAFKEPQRTGITLNAPCKHESERQLQQEAGGGWKRRVALPSRLRMSSCLLRSRQKAGSLSPQEVTASPCLASRGVESARAACQLHLYARCTGASAWPSSVSAVETPSAGGASSDATALVIPHLLNHTGQHNVQALC